MTRIRAPIREEDIERLILDIHSAPLMLDRWPKVVESLCILLNAERALLFSVPLKTGVPFWNVSCRMDPNTTVDYAAEFALDDVWAMETARRGATSPGAIHSGEELIDRRDFLRSRFYNEFLARYGIDRFMNVALIGPKLSNTPAAAACSFYRGVGNDPFGHCEHKILARLTPHLVLAINTFWRMHELSSQSSVLTQTLSSVTAPIFVVDRLGRLVFANRAGRPCFAPENACELSRACYFRRAPFMMRAPARKHSKACSKVVRRRFACLSANQVNK